MKSKSCENLKVLTSIEARKIGSKGGKASVKKRAEKKAMKEMLIAMLEVIDENTGISTQEAMLKAQIDKALAGDTKAFEVLRDTSGQKPKDSVEVSGDIGIIDILTAGRERVKQGSK